MKVLIENIGCDDTTLSIMEVNEEQLKTLISFAKINNSNSSYGCQPKIAIYKKYEKVKYDEEDEESEYYYRHYTEDDLTEKEEHK